MADQPCKICKQIRYFLLVAIPLLILIGTQPDILVPGLQIENIFTTFIAIAFVVVLALGVYTDYFKKK